MAELGLEKTELGIKLSVETLGYHRSPRPGLLNGGRGVPGGG
jgi:hypothetical protein